MTPDAQTLTQRLEGGRLPLNDSLRYALQIVDSLRHIHEEGQCHGALTPDVVLVTRTAVELVAAQPGAMETVTPYTAPERLRSQPVDARTDIFAFGTILYEMLTGRRAFQGAGEAALVSAIENSMPEPIGDTGLDRLVMNCLVKDPAGRWHRVQQLHMELKILSFSAHRARAAALPNPPAPPLQAELRQLDARLTVRLQEHEEAMASLKNATAELPLVESRLTARLEERHGEATAGLRHLAAELPLLETHLAAILEQQRGETNSGLRHLAGELPHLEGRLGSQLAQHEQSLSELHQSAGEVPKLESRLTSRLEEQEQAFAGLRQVPGELSQLESRVRQTEQAADSLGSLAGELPALEIRLQARLDEHAQALTGLQQVTGELQQLVGEIPRLESRLTARLEQHDQALHSLHQLTGELPHLSSQVEQHEQAVAGIPQLAARLDHHEETVVSLRDSAAAHSSALQAASQKLDSSQERLAAVERQLAASQELAVQAARKVVDEGRSDLASLHISLAEELQGVAQIVKEHTAAIQSIRGAMARTDDFMERVVEALESLQTMVLEQARPQSALSTS